MTPPGLSDPVSFGTPRPNVSPVAHLDEQTLARPSNQGWTAPLVTYTVKDPRPVVRAESLKTPLRGGRQLGRAGQPPRRSACWPGTRPSSTPAHWTPTPSSRRRHSSRGQPGRHRHQSQAGIPMERNHRERRVHGNPGGGVLHRQPGRRPLRLAAQPLPRCARRRAEHDHLQRRLVDARLQLRLAGPVLQRRASGRGPRRGPPDGVVRLPVSRSGSGGGSSSTQPKTMDHINVSQIQTPRPRVVIKSVTLDLRLPAPGHRDPRPRVTHRRRPDHRLLDPHVLQPPDHHQRRQADRSRGQRRLSEPLRVRRGANPGCQWARGGVHAPGPAARRRNVAPSPIR